MVSGTNGDAFLIENRANVVWMNFIYHKREHAHFFSSSANNPHAFNRLEALGSVAQKFVLVRRRFFPINPIEIIDRSSQAYLPGRWPGCRLQTYLVDRRKLFSQTSRF